MSRGNARVSLVDVAGADRPGAGATLLALGAPSHVADADEEKNVHLAETVGELADRLPGRCSGGFDVADGTGVRPRARYRPLPDRRSHDATDGRRDGRRQGFFERPHDVGDGRMRVLGAQPVAQASLSGDKDQSAVNLAVARKHMGVVGATGGSDTRSYLRTRRLCVGDSGEPHIG